MGALGSWRESQAWIGSALSVLYTIALATEVEIRVIGRSILTQ